MDLINISFVCYFSSSSLYPYLSLPRPILYIYTATYTHAEVYARNLLTPRRRRYAASYRDPGERRQPRRPVAPTAPDTGTVTSVFQFSATIVGY